MKVITVVLFVLSVVSDAGAASGPVGAMGGFASSAQRDVLLAQRGGKSRGEQRAEEPAGSRSEKESSKEPARERPTLSTLEASPLGVDGRVDVDALDEATKCGISRGLRCDIKAAVERGLFETGLRPRFPAGARCPEIDEGWAISYSEKRDREQYHGGIDMPAPFGTQMIAAAAGTVLAKSAEKQSYRGIEIILRHSPEDTGLPVWTYTQYAHFNEMPSLNIGDRVRMGQQLGPTGNSGFQRPGAKKSRRPAIHFAVWYSDSPQWAMVRSVVVPVAGWWMDPLAFYRKTPPFGSAAAKALPGDHKQVLIPVMFKDGKVEPANTRLIWPYQCTRR